MKSQAVGMKNNADASWFMHLHVLTLKAVACINACKAMLVCKACASARARAGVGVIYLGLLTKVPTVPTALQTESMTRTSIICLLNLWHGSALALSFLFPPHIL